MSRLSLWPQIIYKPISYYYGYLCQIKLISADTIILSPYESADYRAGATQLNRMYNYGDIEIINACYVDVSFSGDKGSNTDLSILENSPLCFLGQNT